MILRASIAVAALLLATRAAGGAEPAAFHFADADDSRMVLEGRAVYQQRCAGCHGKRLQGQPLWQLQDQFQARRAPAHDETGHTWAHSDEELFEMVKSGHWPGSAPGVTSYMPAFAQVLTDDQILAALAYIKARWPTGLRTAQALRNPNNAGMPKDASTQEWTLPPTCTSTVQQWRTAVPTSSSSTD